MPKKRKQESPEAQSDRFKRAVQDMVDAGELDPAEADAAFEKVMHGVAKLHGEWMDGERDPESPA